MPVWYEATEELRKNDEIQLIGIIQEQHRDRCRLFMQWKTMDFPVLVDALNLLEVAAVPLVLGIDEHGVVHELPRDPTKLDKSFLLAESDAPPFAGQAPPPEALPANERDPGPRQRTERIQRISAAGNRLFLGGHPSDLSQAILAYETVLKSGPNDAESLFRLGVAYRARYDSPQRQPGDFQAAVIHWQRALDINPNQYIWRRRIQQYGPLLDKPYPFYGWIRQARKEIAARDETPVELRVEPGGTELAGKHAFQPDTMNITEPDPTARIERDTITVQIETTVVPPTIKPDETARVHVVARPNPAAEGHWNNEAGQLTIWLNPPSGWQVDRRLGTAPNSAPAVSAEPRVVEFEVRCPEGAPPGPVSLPGYALYHVCTGADGACLFRRQDLTVTITIHE